MLKSARESKAVTSWMSPNPAYEAALSGFVRALLDPREGKLFLADLRANVEIVAWYGALNGLTLVLVKACRRACRTSTRATRLIELSLVDPDNRRPVDFDRRRRCMAEAQALLALPDAEARQARCGTGSPTRPTGAPSSGSPGARCSCAGPTRRCCAAPSTCRWRCAAAQAQRVLAFARRDGERWIVVIVGRLFAGLGGEVGKAPTGARLGRHRGRPARRDRPAAAGAALAGGRAHRPAPRAGRRRAAAGPRADRIPGGGAVRRRDRERWIRPTFHRRRRP
jgi:(1->4)-alpha-D-glucan 1-alpha-D-glucosylmutase